MYFSFFKLKKWGKKTAAARRHICAVLPYTFPFLISGAPASACAGRTGPLLRQHQSCRIPGGSGASALHSFAVFYLGHATASFTLATYAHATPGMKRESAKRMTAFIRSVQGA